MTTAAGLPANCAISVDWPIARRSRMPGRVTMSIRSDARAAARAAASAYGAVSMIAPRAPARLAASRVATSRVGGQVTMAGCSAGAVAPSCGGGLHVEIDHGDRSRLRRLDGEVYGDRGLADPALPADYGDHQ